MNFYLKQLALVLVSGFYLTYAQAQDVKIGFVSTDRVLREAAPAKVAQAKLEQEFSKREKDLAAIDSSIKAESSKFERDAPTLPESERLRQQKQLLDKDRDYQRKRREFQEDLTARKNEELQEVIASANQAIKDIAVAEKYDIIFQDAVYANPRIDITDKVLKTLDAMAAGKP